MLIMTATTKPNTYDNNKSRFSLTVEQILTFASSTNFERLKIYLKISNKLRNDVLPYR